MGRAASSPPLKLPLFMGDPDLINTIVPVGEVTILAYWYWFAMDTMWFWFGLLNEVVYYCQCLTNLLELLCIWSSVSEENLSDNLIRFYGLDFLFLSPNHRCQNTEGNSKCQQEKCTH